MSDFILRSLFLWSGRVQYSSSAHPAPGTKAP